MLRAVVVVILLLLFLFTSCTLDRVLDGGGREGGFPDRRGSERNLNHLDIP